MQTEEERQAEETVAEPGTETGSASAAACDVSKEKRPEAVNPLREAPLLKLILKFSVPAVVGMLLNAIYNIVDRAFIGNASYLGESALAALQYCFPPMMITFGLALIFGIGGSVVFSIALGERDYDKARRTMRNAFGLSALLFAVLTVLMAIFAGDVIAWFLPPGTGAAVKDMATRYIRIISYGLMFQSVNVFGNNFIRADGNPVTSMMAILIGAIVNIALDYLFIFPFGMGMEGAALATVIAQGASTVWVLYYFLGKKGTRIFKVARFRLELKKIRFEFKLGGRIVLAGLSAFIMQAAGSVLMIVLNYRITNLAISEGMNAETAVAAMGIIYAVQTVLFMPLVGLNHGMNPIIGYNYGAKLGHRTRKALLIGVAAATCFACIGWGVTRLFPNAVIRIFTTETNLIAYTKQTMRLWLGGTLLLGIAVVGGNYFQASGKAVRAMILSLLRQILIVVPLILILPNFFGLSGLFYAQPVSDIAVTVIVLVLLAIEFLLSPLYRNKTSAPKHHA